MVKCVKDPRGAAFDEFRISEECEVRHLLNGFDILDFTTRHKLEDVQRSRHQKPEKLLRT